MEGKCMRCGKPDHQPGQRCPAKNAKCKEHHKIGHFHKVCQNKKRATQRANLATCPQDNNDTHIDECGDRKPNLPRVNMLKVANHFEANRGKFNEGKHLKFPIASNPRGPYNHLQSQYMHTHFPCKTLQGVDLWHLVHMSTSHHSRF